MTGFAVEERALCRRLSAPRHGSHLLRDLRRIHSHICSVAYSVLDSAGETAAYRSTEGAQASLPAPSAVLK
jgi:hypothetical protein